ncbi:hypothetical protein Nepgr_028673 [Nepenthes gracilis]|uniref:Gnk2-homologous domain-containing protein n=1 Tax=Nepenthes gracilis TaxID=150966 RepID=A0AAD3TC45_NEPGR|nr:hypothetical protein Nepgr_028673 [Nepenthes gracilis]
MATSSAISALSLYIVIAAVGSASQPPADTFVYGGCSQAKYNPNSTYESNLNSLLTSLVNSATYSSYNKFTVIGPTEQDVIYGLYQCRGDLSMPDCATCIAHSVSRLGSLCPESCGGTAQLEGCFVKFDNASFLGVEDKGVLYRRCGPSIGYDARRITGRDAMLAALASGDGGSYYRVGGSGEVQGMAQCAGDLSVDQCRDCIGEAVGRLKSDCGTAELGEMYLGKCYAKYTIGGALSYSNFRKGSSKNQLGIKTFALIIGLLAGIVLLIVFLTFLCRVFGGSGK